MKPDRHNYEEFFILYWDNELAAEQKQLVEEFVQQNTDLQEEFRLFGETRFIPEKTISFANKETLTVDENVFINPSNYRDQLISFIDDELTAEQKSSVEKFIALNPSLQQELSVLQKTKLRPETEIVFPDKSLLYHREEKVRVIRMVWFRAAVAAAIILIAGFVTFRLVNTPDKPGLGEQKNSFSNDQNNTVINDKNPNAGTSTFPEPNPETKIEVNNSALINHSSTPKSEKKNNLTQQTQNQKPDEPLIVQADIPQTSDSQTNPPQPIKGVNDAVIIAETEKPDKVFDNPSVTSRANPSYVVYNPDIKNDQDAEKGGLRGFLRKTTRVFERRTKIQTTTDDNKLLVGVFAVALK